MTGKNRGINGKQLNGSSIDMKRHVKMYKAGKKWLAAGLSTAVLGLTVIGGQQEVNASTNLSNVEQGTSEATSSVNSSALNASSAVVLNTSSSSSNVDNSAHEDQGATVSQSIQTESSASSVGSAVSKTAQDSSTGTIQATSNSNNVQVTNLSNPSSDEITVAQSAASERYQQTGQPQQINAVAATTPVAETTGTVTVNYVNKDTGELITFNQSQSSLTADAGTVVNGSYIAKTTISAASVTKMKVNTKYAQASIAGYKFVGNDTTDFTFVPIGETKTIIAYYEQLAPLIVQYVNEDDESDIIYQNIYDVSKPGMRASGLSSYDVSYNIPELWGYTYDSSKTDQSTLKGTFKSIDDTDGQALIVKVFYKKTTSDINKGALYLTGVINQPVSDSNSNGSGDNNPSVIFNGTSLPSTAIKISNSTSTTPAQYQNYTLVEAAGFSASAETYLGSSASYIPNQPVKVVFGDDSTGKVLLTKSLGDFDPANGVIPSGNYDTSVVNDEQQSSLESQGYRLLGVYGMTSGTYDEMHRVVYYMYTPKLDYGEVTVTRTINFTSSDSSAVLPNPEVQEVTYKTVKNEVTGEIVYTPQEAFYEYIVPNVENYTASQSKVDQEALAPSTTAPTNQTVTINYTPALVHGEVTVDRTISYEKINGSKLQADTVQQVTYKFETNKVSGETVYTPQGFYPAIVSPSFSGYQTTQTTINQDLLKPTTETPKSTKMVVSYTPNKQRATVEIVDQNGKKLDTINVEGVSDGAVDHSTVATAIQGVINQGYNLTSDGTVGATYDHDDDADQTFKVVMTQLGENKVPYTTIPTDPEGNPIPGTTGESHVGKPGDPVETTDVPGYTPTTDIPDVPTDGGDVNVIYTPNKQRATVEIVDQNGKKLDTINVEGVSDGAVDHSTIATAIQGVINQGYNLTSDGTVGATYDHDDDTDQIFKVVMTKIAAPDDTDNNGNPVPPTNNGGDVDNGGNTNNGNDNGNGNVDVPTNNGSETPAQPNTNGSETPSTTTTNTGNGTTGTPKATETTYVNDSGNTNTGDTTQKANANRLPQTDNSNESLLAEIGVAMMGLISVFGLGRKKKHEDD